MHKTGARVKQLPTPRLHRTKPQHTRHARHANKTKQFQQNRRQQQRHKHTRPTQPHSLAPTSITPHQSFPRLRTIPRRRFVSRIKQGMNRIKTYMADFTSLATPTSELAPPPYSYYPQMLEAPKQFEIDDFLMRYNTRDRGGIDLKQPQTMCYLEPSSADFPFQPIGNISTHAALINPTLLSFGSANASPEQVGNSLEPNDVVRFMEKKRKNEIRAQKLENQQKLSLYEEYIQSPGDLQHQQQQQRQNDQGRLGGLWDSIMGEDTESEDDGDEKSNPQKSTATTTTTTHPTTTKKTKKAKRLAKLGGVATGKATDKEVYTNTHFFWNPDTPQLEQFGMNYNTKGEFIFNHRPITNAPLTLHQLPPATTGRLGYVLHDHPNYSNDWKLPYLVTPQQVVGEFWSSNNLFLTEQQDYKQYEVDQHNLDHDEHQYNQNRPLYINSKEKNGKTRRGNHDGTKWFDVEEPDLDNSTQPLGGGDVEEGGSAPATTTTAVKPNPSKTAQSVQKSLDRLSFYRDLLPREEFEAYQKVHRAVHNELENYDENIHTDLLSREQHEQNLLSHLKRVEKSLSPNRKGTQAFQHRYEQVWFPTGKNEPKDGILTAFQYPLERGVTPEHYPGFPFLPLSDWDKNKALNTRPGGGNPNKTSIGDRVDNKTDTTAAPFAETINDDTWHNPFRSYTYDTYLSEILPHQFRTQFHRPVSHPKDLLNLIKNQVAPAEAVNSPSTYLPAYNSLALYNAQFPLDYNLLKNPQSDVYHLPGLDNRHKQSFGTILTPSDSIISTIFQHLQSPKVQYQFLPPHLLQMIGPVSMEGLVQQQQQQQQQQKQSSSHQPAHPTPQATMAATIHNYFNQCIINNDDPKTVSLLKLAPLFYQLYPGDHDRLLSHAFIPDLFHSLRHFVYQHYNPVLFNPTRDGGKNLEIRLFSNFSVNFDQYLTDGWIQNLDKKLRNTQQTLDIFAPWGGNRGGIDQGQHSIGGMSPLLKTLLMQHKRKMAPATIPQPSTNQPPPSDQPFDISTFDLISAVLPNHPAFAPLTPQLVKINDFFRAPTQPAIIHGCVIEPSSRSLISAFTATYGSPYDPSFYGGLDGFTSELRLYEMLRGEQAQFQFGGQQSTSFGQSSTNSISSQQLESQLNITSALKPSPLSNLPIVPQRLMSQKLSLGPNFQVPHRPDVWDLPGNILGGGSGGIGSIGGSGERSSAKKSKK